jgi:hypothetical protein
METSDPDKCGELKDFSVNLYPTQFLMTCEGEIFKINLHINTREFERLKKILGAIIMEKGYSLFMVNKIKLPKIILTFSMCVIPGMLL